MLIIYIYVFLYFQFVVHLLKRYLNFFNDFKDYYVLLAMIASCFLKTFSYLNNIFSYVINNLNVYIFTSKFCDISFISKKAEREVFCSTYENCYFTFFSSNFNKCC